MDLTNFTWHGNDEELCKLKEEGKLVDENDWNLITKQEMEMYTAGTFIEKARLYLANSPPDIMQCSEKIWFAAVYAVKKLYLSCGCVDLKSHNSLIYFCNFAIHCSGLEFDHCEYLRNCWSKAQRMHRDVYGSGNFHLDEYEQIISDIEAFVNEFSKIDCKELWIQFKKMYISKKNHNVKVVKTTEDIKLGGYTFKCDYRVFV